MQFLEPTNKNKITKIMVDQIGYITNEKAKYAFTDGGLSGCFEIIDFLTKSVIYEGKLKRLGNDLQNFNIADFSSVIIKGKYYVEADGVQSLPFDIGDNIYSNAAYMAMRYFTYQREGETNLNIEGHPTFLDDGKRFDNGEHIDVVGGWNDACDYRKWTYCLGFALNILPLAEEIGNYNTDILDYNSIGKNGVPDYIDEAKWGAEYFLKMQDTLTGMIYPFCGADGENYLNNYFSDCIIGSADDRTVEVVRDNNNNNIQKKLFVQYECASGLAALSTRIFKYDREYSLKLKKAAERVWDYAEKQEIIEPIYASTEICFKALCTVNMYKMLQKYEASDVELQKYKEEAILSIKTMLKSQQNNTNNEQSVASGWFWGSINSRDTFPTFNAYTGGIQLLSLSEVYRVFGEEAEEKNIWREAAIKYVENYVKVFAENNPFGFIPLEINKEKSLTKRQLEKSTVYYNYFLNENGEWVVGNNGSQLGNAAALLSCVDSGILNLRNDLKEYSIKQALRAVHLIHGANPQGDTYIRGIGTQSPYFKWGRGKIHIPGALVAGCLGADNDDEPVFIDNSFKSSEYWTPYNSFYVLTLAFLDKLNISRNLNDCIDTPSILNVFASEDGLLVDFTCINKASTYTFYCKDVENDKVVEGYCHISPARIYGLEKGKTYNVQMKANGIMGCSNMSNTKKIFIDGQYTYFDNFVNLEKTHSTYNIEDILNIITVTNDETYLIYYSISDFTSFSVEIDKMPLGAYVKAFAISGANGKSVDLGELSRKSNNDKHLFSLDEIKIEAKYLKIAIINGCGSIVKNVRIRAENPPNYDWIKKPNIAPTATLSCSSTENDNYLKINDGLPGSDNDYIWGSWLNLEPIVLNFKFSKYETISHLDIYHTNHSPLSEFSFQALIDGKWEDVILPVVGNYAYLSQYNFNPINSNEFRLLLQRGQLSNERHITLNEVYLR